MRHRITCVDGTLGTGKSSLLAEMARQAQAAGFAVRTATATAGETALPFGVVDQLFPGKLDGLDLVGDVHSVLRHVTRHLRALAAQQPIFVGVDNVDKADEQSVRWLTFVHHRMADLPVSMVLTTGPARSGLVNELIGPLARIRLRGLELGGCARMIGPAPAEYVAACHAATGGNPYLLRELLAAREPMTAEGIDAAAGAVAISLVPRLRWHGDDVLAMAKAVALIDKSTIPLAAAAAGLSTERGMVAAATLGELGFVAGEPLAITYPIAAKALRYTISSPEREVAHGRAARFLSAARRERSPDHGPDHSADLGADPVADARRTLAQAYEIANRQDRHRAVTALDTAADAVVQADPDLGHSLQLYASRLIIEESCVDTDLAPRLARLCAEPAMSAQNGLLLAALRAYRECLRGEDSGRVATLAAAVPPRLAESAGGDVIDRAAFTHIVIALMIADELEAALKLCDDALAVTASREVPVAAAQAHSLRAHILLRLGRLAHAEEAGQAALDLFGQLKLGRQRVVTLAVTALCSAWAEMGDPERALRELAAYRLDGEVPGSRRFDRVLYHRGIVRSRLGDHGGALLDLLECGKRLIGRGVLNPSGTAWRSHAAEEYLALGRPGDALRLVEQEVTLARRWGRPRALGTALRVAGVAAQEQGAELLAESVQVLTDSPARLQLARSLLSWGPFLPPADRRPVFRRAHDLAKSCGAVPVMTMAANELRAAGGRRSRQHSFSLTDQEMCVASMAVRGRTNREIAAELYVTQRAVEQHLTKVYRKLGITGRAQLACALPAHWPGGDP
nr:helix-turn-helix transcriptional regulator [Kibdelosporangium sp. MJ126-NF4]